MRVIVLRFVATAVALVVGAAPALAGPGPTPYSLRPELELLSFDAVGHRALVPLDVTTLLREDARNARQPGVPWRVAAIRATHLSPRDSGSWETLADGARLWRLRLTSPGALFLAFELADFELPGGAELRFVSVEREHAIGPFTTRNNNAARLFGSPIVAGASAVIELYLPPGAEREPNFVVRSISHGYRDFRGVARLPYRPGREPAEPAPVPPPWKDVSCEVDVNCPEGAQWQDDKRAVAETFDGSFVCTGTLLNNVRGDCRNLFLTANHCTGSPGKASRLVFFWNYENSGCDTGDAPTDQTTTGSTLLDNHNKSDYSILELVEPPPASFGVYHAGWNRSAAPAGSGVTLHHPNDLPKKISFEFDPIEDGGDFSGGWGDDHWRVVGWDVGTTEPGSSGSGLWNAAHQVVGQLHGGVGDCNGGWDEYGKLSVSWTLGLAAILDPDGTGALSVDGVDCAGGPPPPPPPPVCELGQKGDPCVVDADCCSGKCKGPAAGKSCR